MKRIEGVRRVTRLVVVSAMACVLAPASSPFSSGSAAPPGGTVHDRPPPKVSTVDRQASLDAAYGKLPISFEANDGQADPRVRFLSRGPGYQLFLTSNEAVLSWRRPETRARAAKPQQLAARLGARQGKKAPAKCAVLRMRLNGANPKPKVSGVDQLAGRSNYFIGHEPKKWRTHVPNYAAVRYQDVYPGVGMVYRGDSNRQLEYQFEVAPGARPRVIELAFRGAERMRISQRGEL